MSPPAARLSCYHEPIQALPQRAHPHPPLAYLPSPSDLPSHHYSRRPPADTAFLRLLKDLKLKPAQLLKQKALVTEASSMAGARMQPLRGSQRSHTRAACPAPAPSPPPPPPPTRPATCTCACPLQVLLYHVFPSFPIYAKDLKIRQARSAALPWPAAPSPPACLPACRRCLPACCGPCLPACMHAMLLREHPRICPPTDTSPSLPCLCACSGSRPW